MVTDNVQRFTTEQVLRGIQRFVDEVVGDDVRVRPDESVNCYADVINKNYGCPLEFLWGLSIYFGLNWNIERWVVWLQLPRPRRNERLSKREQESHWEDWQQTTSQSITVRKLAEYIARHARGVSMQPVTVFGRHCAPAGVFRGLCELPEVRGKRIGPSTELRSIMGAWKLEEFWKRAEWVSGQKLPQLSIWSVWTSPLPWRWVAPAILAYVGGACLLGGLAAQFGLPLWLMSVICVGLFFATAAWIENNVRNPIPDEVQTFGDLARLIAQSSKVAG